MSFKFGTTSRKDRIAARFLGQVHSVLAYCAEEVRRERGVKQADVARELGVNRATISRLLSGAGNPTARTIGELAGAMGYRPELVMRKVETRPHSNHGTIVIMGNRVLGGPLNEADGSATQTSAVIYSPKTSTAEPLELIK